MQQKLPTPPPFALARVELRALAITSIEFAITPLRITVAMAQPGRHLSTVPTSLLAVSGPTWRGATAMPAFPSPGTAKLSRRACAAEVVRAGRVYIRCSAGVVTWLARPTGISAAHMPCIASVAAREGWRANR
jgi:hypothetical protein